MRPNFRLLPKWSHTKKSLESAGRPGGRDPGNSHGPLLGTLAQILRVLWSAEILHLDPLLCELRMLCHGQDDCCPARVVVHSPWSQELVLLLGGKINPVASTMNPQGQGQP